MPKITQDELEYFLNDDEEVDDEKVKEPRYPVQVSNGNYISTSRTRKLKFKHKVEDDE